MATLGIVQRLSRRTYILVMVALSAVFFVVVSQGPWWLWDVLAVVTFADLGRRYLRRRRARRTAPAVPTAERSASLPDDPYEGAYR